MKLPIKEINLEIYKDKTGVFHVKLDNTLNNQCFNILSTSDKEQAFSLFLDLKDVLYDHMEK